MLPLTKRSTKMAGNLHHNDVRPRIAATPSDPGFVAAKKPILDFFQREVRR